jgi:hypothetical protein
MLKYFFARILKHFVKYWKKPKKYCNSSENVRKSQRKCQLKCWSQKLNVDEIKKGWKKPKKC